MSCWEIISTASFFKKNMLSTKRIEVVTELNVTVDVVLGNECSINSDTDLILCTLNLRFVITHLIILNHYILVSPIYPNSYKIYVIFNFVKSYLAN